MAHSETLSLDASNVPDERKSADVLPPFRAYGSKRTLNSRRSSSGIGQLSKQCVTQTSAVGGRRDDRGCLCLSGGGDGPGRRPWLRRSLRCPLCCRKRGPRLRSPALRRCRRPSRTGQPGRRQRHGGPASERDRRRQEAGGGTEEAVRRSTGLRGRQQPGGHGRLPKRPVPMAQHAQQGLHHASGRLDAI